MRLFFFYPFLCILKRCSFNGQCASSPYLALSLYIPRRRIKEPLWFLSTLIPSQPLVEFTRKPTSLVQTSPGCLSAREFPMATKDSLYCVFFFSVTHNRFCPIKGQEVCVCVCVSRACMCVHTTFVVSMCDIFL